MTETEVVEAFLDALQDLDVDRALGLCAEDVFYQNVSLPPARGKAAVEKQLRGMARLGAGFRIEVRNIAAKGPVVLTERVDTIVRGGFEMEFWVCGSFEVREGRISVWRDYFDWGNFMAAGVKGAGRVAWAALSRARGR